MSLLRTLGGVFFFFFSSSTPAFTVWPFQFKCCKILGMKSEMQPFAAPLLDETFPERGATGKSWKLAASHPLQTIAQWAQLQGRSSQGCQCEEFVPAGS